MVQNTTENLGPAERLIETLLIYKDHLFHNRPGYVVPDATTAVGVTWHPGKKKPEADGTTTFIRLDLVGKKSRETPIGKLHEDGTIRNGAAILGRYREAGIFPEVAVWSYARIAEIWGLSHEFVARWASFSYPQDHKDLKVLLAAFMLVQSKKGDPVVEGGELIFHDADHRDVGEAMVLHLRDDKNHMEPKAILRIHDLLTLPEIAEINRKLGFTTSPKNPFLGRWELAVQKWLRYREQNPALLHGLIRAGWKTTVVELAQRSHYKPETPRFFQALRWKQKQTSEGHRALAIGEAVKAAETWEGKSEREICEIVVKTKPNWKRITSLVPLALGVTRAIAAAAVESGSLSDSDLIIATPTLESLDLLSVPDVRARWDRAMQTAKDMRAANIARNARTKEVKEKLEGAADTALQTALKEETKDIRLYWFIDTSASQELSIERSKQLLAKCLQGFPLDRSHVATFNTVGIELTIQAAKAAAVTKALEGVRAGGGTDIGSGVLRLMSRRPKPGEDVIFIFVTDEEAYPFTAAVRQSNLNPIAFGLVKMPGLQGAPAGVRARYGAIDPRAVDAVTLTAAELGVPCFRIDEKTFEDPYAIPRTLRALIAAAPVGRATPVAGPPRLTLVERILQTELLTKPAWAA